MKISYVEQGAPDATPVLLLHGLGDSWRSYEPVLQFLPDSVHAVALSQRGHGDSSKPTSGYRVRHFADDLAAFMDAAGIESAVLAGHSSHTLVCERFAIDHPDRTVGLVLIGAPVTLRGHAAAREMFERSISRLTDPIDVTFVREFTDGSFVRQLPAHFVETVRGETLKVPARVFKELFEDLMETDLRSDLDKIRAPALLVWGDRDEIVSHADQQELTDRLPNALLLVYSGSGHSPHWEEPDRFASDLVTFVARLAE